jgi:hypothetical protein
METIHKADPRKKKLPTMLERKRRESAEEWPG